MRVVSDERGNSYEVEEIDTKSKITDQFLRLANFLDFRPIDILTGVAAPFRSCSWSDFTKYERTESLVLGKPFWGEVLRRPNLKLIFVCSMDAAKLVRDITDAVLMKECLAAWGEIKLKRYETLGGKVIIHLPHLSRFTLLGRPESEEAIQRIID